MSTEALRERNNLARRNRRVLLTTFGVGLLIVLAMLAWVFGPFAVAYLSYEPQEGDVLFQSLPKMRLVNAIEGVTGSPYSHCGIVAKENGSWVVYESIGNTHATPLLQFLARGRNLGFAVYRLKPEYREHIASTLEHAKGYVGRPYDIRYRMDDEKIYCSELVYKAYRDATGGEELGQLVRFGDMNWQPYEETIYYYERGPVPVDRMMITPKHLAKAEQLELVSAHAIRAE
jgi:hypothetical protein